MDDSYNRFGENKKSLSGKFKLFFKSACPQLLRDSVAGGDYFRNKVNAWLLALSLLANIANWVILAIFIRPTDNNIILHYNVYFGVDMMGSWKSVFVLPSVGLALFLINFFLSKYFYRNKEKVASYILLIALFMAQLSLLIATLSVIIINY